MKISLFQGILMGAFALAAVVGLFVFASYSGGGGASKTGPVLIWGTLPGESVERTIALARLANEAFSDLKYVEKDRATLVGDLATAIAIGASPDLVLASQEELHGLSKFLAPLSSETISASTFTSTFIEGAKVYTAPGGWWGIPFLVDPLVLFYNRSVLSSSGVAQPPSTWEALTGLVPNVAVLTPTRQIERGLIALGTYGNVRNARGILSSLFFQTGVPISYQSTGGVLSANLGLDERSGPPPGQAVVSFYTQFADPAKVSYTWNASLPDSREFFLVGDLALYLGYASEARYLREANPNLNFEVAPLPQPATAAVKSAHGLVYAFMLPRGAKNPQGAFQIAALFSNPAEQSSAALATGLAPVNLNVLATPPGGDSVAGVAYREALYTRGWLSPTPANTDLVFSSMISSVITGRLSVSAALANAQSSLSALLQQ